jgi:very-short-patch-repair endonuclease
MRMLSWKSSPSPDGEGDHLPRDERRDAWKRSQGLQVIRYDADEVIKDLESVVTAILLAARR